jgi:hypothetical protein
MFSEFGGKVSKFKVTFQTGNLKGWISTFAHFFLPTLKIPIKMKRQWIFSTNTSKNWYKFEALLKINQIWMTQTKQCKYFSAFKKK